MTMSRLPKTGEAVIIDLGEGKDIHPKNKQDVAKRLARWALARDYGVKVAYQSPTYKAMEKHGNKIVLTFDHVGGGLKAVRRRRAARVRHRRQRPQVRLGQGEDRRPRQGRGLVRRGRPSRSPSATPGPTTRSATSTAPRACPLTPFRTDDWPGVTVNNDRSRSAQSSGCRPSIDRPWHSGE